MTDEPTTGPTDEPVGIPAEELTGDLGPPDVTVMQAIRDLFLAEEPLVETVEFDSILQPTELSVMFSDGIGDATWCRLDVTWYRRGYYRFHYVDSTDVSWRFDRHPNPHSPTAHFHEPPDGTSDTAVDSCIEVTEPELVTRAVLKLWRRAYETASIGTLNTAINPP